MSYFDKVSILSSTYAFYKGSRVSEKDLLK